MATFPRSGLFSFLLLLAALAPAGAGAVTTPLEGDPGSVEARLRRISAALREQAPEQSEATTGEGQQADGRLAFVWGNGGGFRNGGFRNGGFGNGGFGNGGWGNGGFGNGGWGNGGFGNGGFLNGPLLRPGGFVNFW
ncbi:rSAM-associated Gly-rich repeat protein [Cyanobium sp. HWJ4-Hawea]|uniref:GrrA/OscA1 family cyclophane-containing rSAM-modified RiPP n=1 Tax=unclassified Cyanobium TaxID=2627006 RepID=UPI0020CD6584|nr:MULTISPECIES: GrrA/OscA1 family cyclophane-containing rSAM-modified RiPP [unclassified Cyanobium]MCP9775389.1 rSAM-associated Gly-rich repeat protein [Cyanobium sp. WAJ14-Wanaka]MCP9808518.1 rSAM-associated Gly-rich repeat protein [Cyanobium sp. HWJ4-Hawea]